MLERAWVAMAHFSDFVSFVWALDILRVASSKPKIDEQHLSQTERSCHAGIEVILRCDYYLRDHLQSTQAPNCRGDVCRRRVLCCSEYLRLRPNCTLNVNDVSYADAGIRYMGGRAPPSLASRSPPASLSMPPSKLLPWLTLASLASISLFSMTVPGGEDS